MDTKDGTSGCRLARTVCHALVLGGGVAIDPRPVIGEQSLVEVAPGEHVIEVMCTARVFVGMGTMDFPSQSVATIQAESGQEYRLDAKVAVQGDCTPVLE